MRNKPVFWIFLVSGIALLFVAWHFQRGYLERNPLIKDAPANTPAIVSSPPADEMQTTLAKLEKSVAAEPQKAAHRWALADAYQKAGQIREAETQLRAIAALEPKRPESRMALANLYLALQDFSSAEKMYRESAQLSPKSALAWQGLATTLYHQKRYFESLEAARKGAAVAPDDPNSDVVLAAAALDFTTQFPNPHQTKSAELKLAKQRFSKALQKLPDNGSLYLRLGTVCLALRDGKSAISNLKRATELMPGQVEPVILLTRALLVDNQREAARRHVEAALQQYPQSAELNNLMSRAWRNSNTPDGPQKSYEFIRRAVELAPQNAEYQETLGIAALRLKKLDEAKEAFTRALQINPNARMPYLQLSAINNQLGQAKSATTYAKKLAETNAQESELRKLEQWVQARPKDAAVRATLADWYLKRGFIGAARDTYLQALRLQPSNTRIKERLAEVQNQMRPRNPLSNANSADVKPPQAIPAR